MSSPTCLFNHPLTFVSIWVHQGQGFSRLSDDLLVDERFLATDFVNVANVTGEQIRALRVDAYLVSGPAATSFTGHSYDSLFGNGTGAGNVADIVVHPGATCAQNGVVVRSNRGVAVTLSGGLDGKGLLRYNAGSADPAERRRPGTRARFRRSRVRRQGLGALPLRALG